MTYSLNCFVTDRHHCNCCCGYFQVSDSVALRFAVFWMWSTWWLLQVTSIFTCWRVAHLVAGTNCVLIWPTSRMRRDLLNILSSPLPRPQTTTDWSWAPIPATPVCSFNPLLSNPATKIGELSERCVLYVCPSDCLSSELVQNRCLKPNSITLAGSSKPNSITLSGSNQLRTSSEQASNQIA